MRRFRGSLTTRFDATARSSALPPGFRPASSVWSGRFGLPCLLILVACARPLLAADARWVGSKVCGGCHAEIYRTYSATPMALSSGPAGSIPISEQSFSGNSGYRYSIVHQKQKLFLDLRKPNAKISERRELAWFAGSGASARSFLIAIDGFLYEAPVTYYSRPRAWALSPGYDRYSYPFLTRAIAPGCLQCHATGVQAIPGTQNGYQSPPFLEGGVGCERCHGPGAAHAASGKAGDIVNPASLPAEPRDSVCAQCHLSGEIRVERGGKSMSDFTAGAKLSDYAIAFVRATSAPGMKVTSHAEDVARSACSRGSGGRLWCGSCHDPHFVPSAAKRALWFRSKCQTCHASSQCQRGDNCIACHMPTSPVTDADHVVYTDHSIPRRPVPRNQKPPAEAPLVAFQGAPADPRDQGLAYAIVALREQNAVYSARAFDLLREAERRNPNDAQTLSYLADLYKTRNDNQNAARLYQRLYAIDRTLSSAPMNLGAYQIEQGHFEEAIRLFKEALRISPALVLVRLNLAIALIRTGQAAEAHSVLEKALEFNPSFTAARDLLNHVR
jgi:Tetratricopeptide repeat/Cytochrome c554 and c-prime